MIKKKNKSIYVQIIEEAFRISNMPTSESFTKSFPNMSIEEKTRELSTPRVVAHMEDETPTVFLRFVEMGMPLIEAIYYPHFAAEIFFENAKTTLKDYYGFDEIALDERARKEAVNMLITMFRRLYARMSITMAQILDETTLDWQKKEWEIFGRVSAPEGIKLPRIKHSERFNNLSSSYNKDVKAIWKNEEQKRDDWDKLQLAKEYPSILNHWEKLQKDLRNNIDWREYAKAGKFSDTPDDLLDLLLDTERKKLSFLAVEHTARRIGIMNIHGAKESDREKWKQGITVTGYDAQHLLDLKTDGNKLLKKLRSDIIQKTSEQKA
jgi:hypothetical protein